MPPIRRAEVRNSAARALQSSIEVVIEENRRLARENASLRESLKRIAGIAGGASAGVPTSASRPGRNGRTPGAGRTP